MQCKKIISPSLFKASKSAPSTLSHFSSDSVFVPIAKIQLMQFTVHVHCSVYIGEFEIVKS